MKLNNIFFYGICIFAFGLSACEKFVEIEPPINSFVAKTAFENDDLVRADIAGLYSYNFVMTAYHDTYQIIFPALCSDEMTYYTTSYEEFTNNEILTLNTNARNMWILPYRGIYQSNTIITALDNSGTNISDAVKAEGLGVAKFFRALSYLNLVSVFGAVPLVTTTDVQVSNSLGRTPRTQIFELIHKDLNEARIHLKNVNKPNVYITERAVVALQARAFLYNDQWQQAYDAANELISGSLKGSLQLEELDKTFKRVSKETIFAISTNGSNPQVVNHNFVGRALIHNGVRVVYKVSESLLNAFEVNDKRKEKWISYFSSTLANSGYYFSKYKLNRAPTDATLAEDQVLIRLSEIYLIRAEAAAQLGGQHIAGAVNDINQIRQRAGLNVLPATLSKDAILLAVEQERRVELFAEYGHRWMDVIRTGRADAVFGAQKPTWKSHAKLFPIPQMEINLNPNLEQNPGYD